MSQLNLKDLSDYIVNYISKPEQDFIEIEMGIQKLLLGFDLLTFTVYKKHIDGKFPVSTISFHINNEGLFETPIISVNQSDSYCFDDDELLSIATENKGFGQAQRVLKLQTIANYYMTLILFGVDSVPMIQQKVIEYLKNK